MSTEPSVTRRDILRIAGAATIAAGVWAPFRERGNVVRAQTAQTYKKWVVAKPVVDRKLTIENFRLIEEPIPRIRDGQCLIKVRLINIHAATRDRMGPNGAVQVGETDNTNYACADVLESRDRTFKEGDTIACLAGWQTHQVISSSDGQQPGYNLPSELVKELNGTNSGWAYVFRPVMTRMYRPDVLMDVFVTSGITAYFGMRQCGPLMPRDKVAVAGTTGSVGSIFAQLAKERGCYVVGFGGGPARTKWVTDNLGIPAIDYRAQDLDLQLKAAFPDGIDVFSDGVAAELSESVARLMNRNSRYFAYGSAGPIYDDTPRVEQQRAGRAPAGPRVGRQPQITNRGPGMSDSIYKIVQERNIKVEAWQVQYLYQDRIEAENYLSRLMYGGLLKPFHTVIEGIENVPKGIVAQYDSNVYGKLQLKFAD
jgi:NADPH-dependent curcumin reductase CurA